MNRRQFIRNAGIYSGMLLVPGTFPVTPVTPVKPRFKLGYQLFSIRDEMERDALSTLKALKKMGYRDFEIYGYDDTTDSIYDFRSAELKKILDDLGLTVSSGHYGFYPYLDKSDDELKRFVDRCIVGAKNLDSKYITWPWLAPEQRALDSYKVLADKLNIAGEKVREAGLGFAYHNHGYEFDDLGGQTGFDVITEETDASLVKLQLDMYWLMRSSKYTPKELVDAQPGRYVMWHIKDMDKLTEDYTELGNGSIDYLTLLPDPEKSGLEFYYLEQGGNFTTDSKTSAADSARYFRKKLQKFL